MAIDALPIHHNTIAPPPPPPPPTNVVHHHPFSLFTHFYWGKDAEILFSGWPGHNSAMYALALLFVFFSAVLVELFSNINVVRPGSKRVAAILFQMGIRAIRAGFAYLVMLSVISYNGGIFIAAVVGHAVGYVAFGSPVSILRKGSANTAEVSILSCLNMFGMHLVNVCKMIHRKFQLASSLPSLPSLLGASSPPESPQYSSFWISYMMQFYPGWPNHQSLGECIFSMFLVFLLAFTTEICPTSNDPISIKQQCRRRRRRHEVRGLLIDAGLHGLRMFMAYLVMISVITGDFMFLLVALAGHTAGCFFTKLFEYQIEQTIAEPRSKQASLWVT